MTTDSIGKSNDVKRGPKRKNRFVGVSWHAKANKWRARIDAQFTSHHLGLFESEVAAAKAYDEAAKDFHGKRAVLNFPNGNK